ncbi:MAG TPA: hypothetical protein VFS60_05840 [Thermoanaerobaculia bacterium]|nr:hypothetical protein [Thermoanaerobaculia bacterium]
MKAGWWRRRRAFDWLGRRKRPAIDHRQLLDRHPGLLHEAVSALTVSDRLTGEELAALELSLRARIAENDFESLRDYKGHDAFRTYLYFVVSRALWDYREERWQRWWQGAEESGHGDAVDRLQQLVCDEALSLGEALDEVAGDDSTRRTELEAVWASQPWSKREVTDLKWLDLTESQELIREPTALERHLSAAIRKLPAEDRLVLDMHFRGNVSLAAIANWRRRSVEEESRVFAELLRGIGDYLAHAGVEAADIGALLSDPRPGYVRKASAAAAGRKSPAHEGENDDSRPSNPVRMPDDPSNGD